MKIGFFVAFLCSLCLVHIGSDNLSNKRSGSLVHSATPNKPRFGGERECLTDGPGMGQVRLRDMLTRNSAHGFSCKGLPFCHPFVRLCKNSLHPKVPNLVDCGHGYKHKIITYPKIRENTYTQQHVLLQPCAHTHTRTHAQSCATRMWDTSHETRSESNWPYCHVQNHWMESRREYTALEIWSLLQHNARQLRRVPFLMCGHNKFASLG